MFSTRRSLLRVLEREREAFAAERARLIDQIMHLSNRTWTPPPHDYTYPVEPEVDPEHEWTEATV